MYCLLSPKTHHLTSLSKSAVTKYENAAAKIHRHTEWLGLEGILKII